MIQWVNRLLCKPENLSLSPQNPHKCQGGIVACNPSMWETETGSPGTIWWVKLTKIVSSVQVRDPSLWQATKEDTR